MAYEYVKNIVSTIGNGIVDKKEFISLGTAVLNYC